MGAVSSQFGVRHPGGGVTVHVTGHPFPSRAQAEAEAAMFDAQAAATHCEECGEDAAAGTHQVVTRNVGDWAP